MHSVGVGVQTSSPAVGGGGLQESFVSWMVSRPQLGVVEPQHCYIFSINSYKCDPVASSDPLTFIVG